METTGWDIALTVSTIVLAVATVILAIATGVLAFAAIRAGKTALDQLKTVVKLADADTSRRRAERSHEALRRFMTTFDRQHPIMLDAARAETKAREAARPNPDVPVTQVMIQDLLSEENLRNYRTPEEALDALRKCLDALEELAVGVALNVYDEYVFYHAAHSSIRQLIRWGTPYMTMCREGARGAATRPQPTAFELTLQLKARFDQIEQKGAPARLAGALNNIVEETVPAKPPKKKSRNQVL